MAEKHGPTRLEHDLLGQREIDAHAYYGVQTLRGLENFHISGVPLAHYPELVEAFAMVKMAAAMGMDKRLAENLLRGFKRFVEGPGAPGAH